MGRFLVDVPADDVRKLDEIAKREGKSRAAVLREAVSEYLQIFGKDGFEKYFGLWARHGVEIEPTEYDRKRRAEWTRPWDDDYEEVRAESPDMFDEYDDKERAHYLALTKKAAAKHKKKAA
jgi:Ribbon-helix-helix protein, copG family